MAQQGDLFRADADRLIRGNRGEAGLNSLQYGLGVQSAGIGKEEDAARFFGEIGFEWSAAIGYAHGQQLQFGINVRDNVKAAQDRFAGHSSSYQYRCYGDFFHAPSREKKFIVRRLFGTQGGQQRRTVGRENRN